MADEAVPGTSLRGTRDPTSDERAPRSRGARLARWRGWLFVLPALVMYGAFVIVPLVLAILAFALYPQAALTASEPAVEAATRQVAR